MAKEIVWINISLYWELEFREPNNFNNKLFKDFSLSLIYKNFIALEKY